MKVQKIGINLIKPYWRNPRRSDAAVGAVKASIERYGFNSPIIVDTDHVIIAGHTRYRALRELGWKDIPVVVLDLPADKVKEYRIADNRTSELAEWDYDLLIPELREIGNLDDFSVFFPDEDLADLLDTGTPDVVDPLATQEQIDALQERRDHEIGEGAKQRTERLLHCMCPECGAEFSVNPDTKIPT